MLRIYPRILNRGKLVLTGLVLILIMAMGPFSALADEVRVLRNALAATTVLSTLELGTIAALGYLFYESRQELDLFPQSRLLDIGKNLKKLGREKNWGILKYEIRNHQGNHSNWDSENLDMQELRLFWDNAGGYDGWLTRKGDKIARNRESEMAGELTRYLNCQVTKNVNSRPNTVIMPADTLLLYCFIPADARRVELVAQVIAEKDTQGKDS